MLSSQGELSIGALVHVLCAPCAPCLVMMRALFPWPVSRSLIAPRSSALLFL
ncbi:uncharacterized protein DS421_14g465580 [Arachis hypogaea]|nr:uncharacterized protein DS421_14g465580 [Arachis hypogaea]